MTVRHNRKALIIVGIVIMIAIGTSLLGISLPLQNTNTYAADTEVTISIQTGYELIYKAQSFLTEESGSYYPDSELFAILEFSVLGVSVTDFTPQDIIVTGQAIMKDVDSYALTFSIDSSHPIYYGELITDIDISSKELQVSLPASPYIYYGQTLNDLGLEYVGFAAGETAQSLVTAGKLIEPTITNVYSTILSPENNGSITIALNSDGSADNYTLLTNTDENILTIEKARVEVSFSSNNLPYIYDYYIYNNEPTSDVYNLMVFENTDIEEVILADLPQSHIIVSNPTNLINAGSHNLTISIDNANVYYTISPMQSTITLIINKVELSILPSNASDYFTITDTKAYDATTAFSSITILDSSIIGVNNESLTINSVNAVYGTKDVGTEKTYAISFTVTSGNYEPQDIVMTGVLGGEITEYEITQFYVQNFFGIKTSKEYDTTYDMERYDTAIYIPHNFLEVVGYLSGKMVALYGLTPTQSQQFIFSIATCLTDGESYSDEYAVLRISYYDSLNLLYSYLLDPLDAEEAVNGFINNISSWLDDQSYSYDLYQGDEVADLYFTEFNEVIKLVNPGFHIFGEYITKNASYDVNGEPYVIDYSIYFTDFTNNNYSLSSSSVQGNDGMIEKAVVGVVFPTLNKIYGDDTPINYHVPFVTKAQIDALAGEISTQENNVITLPYVTRAHFGGGIYSYFNQVLSGFYVSDLSDPEIAAILDIDQLLINFVLAIPDVHLNVYNLQSAIGVAPTRYGLLMELISNYNFLGILKLLEDYVKPTQPEHFLAPGIVIEPRELNCDSLDVNISREYNAQSEVVFSVSSPDFAMNEDGNGPYNENLYFSISVLAEFVDTFGTQIEIVSNNLKITNFNINITINEDGQMKYSDNERALMVHNYSIDIQSIGLLISMLSDIALNVKTYNALEEEIWIDWDNYMLLHSDKDILDFEIMGLYADTVSITPAQLAISVVEGQEFIYGNDILADIQYQYMNFHQSNPADIFTLSYTIYNPELNLVQDAENNLPTGLLPSVDFYKIQLASSFLYDNDWYNTFGSNYNLVDVTVQDQIDILIKKASLQFAIQDKEKYFGDLDPAFSFSSISGYRDSDLSNLISLLQRTAATASNENAESFVEIELLQHPYYDYIEQPGVPYTAEMFIRKRNLSIVPIAFDVPYGTANKISGTFTVNKVYQANLPLYPDLDLQLIYNCFANSLDATITYAHSVTSLQFALSEPNRNNFNISLSNGSNKVMISPLEISINLTKSTTKQYDALPLSILLEDFDTDMPTLVYGERLYEAQLFGYIYNLLNDSYEKDPNIGAKIIRQESITVFNEFNFVVPSSNYNFVVATSGEITPKDIQINTSPAGEIYKKTYDGSPLTVAFNDNMSIGFGLLSGHQFDAETIWFETSSANASIFPMSLNLKQAVGGFKIFDEENDVTANYNLLTSNFGQGEIVFRRITASLSSTYYYTYDGNRVAIDLEDGSMYTEKLSVYTPILDEFSQPIQRSIVFEYGANYNSNTIGTVFVNDHYAKGRLITSTANAISSAMVLVGEISIEGSIQGNYVIEYQTSFVINIAQRQILIDINSLETIDGYPSKIYDGTPFSVSLTTEMANNLLAGHTLSGSRRTADSNVTLQGGVAQPKPINNSLNLVIVDENTANVTSNYLITFVERKAVIDKRTISIDINEDVSVSKVMVYNKTLFVINISSNMAINIVNGETVNQGSLSTLDSNAYTLDDFNQIIYDGEDFAKKIMQISNPIKIFKLNAQSEVVESTNNYSIELINNYVTILPKQVKVDMSKEYTFLDFRYTGSIHEFSVTNTMIRDMTVDATGLVYGHNVLSASTPLRSASVNAANGVDVLYPEGEVYIEDEYITNNYVFNFIPIQINITKRQLEINVSLGGIALSKVYDSEIFEIDLNSNMDIYISDPSRGLVEGHIIIGKARTVNGFVGSHKALVPEFNQITDSGLFEDYIDNYTIIFTPATASITPRQLDIDINAGVPDGHKKVYDAEKLTVYITSAMISGLQGDDYLVDEGDNKSYRSTTIIIAGTFSLNTQAEGDIVINRTGIEGNLASNYTFNYINGGMVQILQRRIYITVRNDEGYYTDDEGDYISGLRNVYYDDFYTVNHTKYNIDNADYDNDGFGFRLVDRHKFAAGTRRTQSKFANNKILLIANQNVLIENENNINVTVNYNIIYQEVYFEIYKRKILFDVARNDEGDTSNYDQKGSFIKTYDRHIFEIQINKYMVFSFTDYLEIVNGHSISQGHLQSVDPYVERDSLGKVISKRLIWSPQRPLIITDGTNTVTDNYDIDINDANYNFVERVVTIEPQLLIIDIANGMSTYDTKTYDGTPFRVDIFSTMVISTAGGFVGDYTGGGQLNNKDEIRMFSGYRVTEYSDVAYNGGQVTSILLNNGQEIIIENPEKQDVTNNYNIKYVKNLFLETPGQTEGWATIIEDIANDEIPERYLPKVFITPRSMTLNISNSEKIQKYYDGEPFNLTFSIKDGVFQHSGTVINQNLSSLLTVSGLVPGERAHFTITTENGDVDPHKVWLCNPEHIIILKNDGGDSKSNYSINDPSTYFAHIRPRQICIDVNRGLPQIAEHIYDGSYYVVQIDNSMVLQNSENNALLINDTDSLGLLEGHTIMGSRRSISAISGIQSLMSHGDIVILDGDEIDVTSQYASNEATNQKVNILKAELLVNISNSGISMEKVYDGNVFTINLSHEETISGLKSPLHYVANGTIKTLDKDVGENKPTECDTTKIVIMQHVEGEGAVDINVTSNYFFTYIEWPLTITPKGITIKSDTEFYKPFNGTKDIVLLPKHYTFNAGDVCYNDIVLLSQYAAEFTSAESGGSGETITVSNLALNNNNYYLINSTFDIIGHIILFNPMVTVENSSQIEGTDGTTFVYDGTPKTAVYTLIGLEGAEVLHSVSYKLSTTAGDEDIEGVPTQAGLYKMILSTKDIDPNYPNWKGATIMIQINAAQIVISFTGSLNQNYGEVTPITARAVSGGGLNENLTPIYTPIYPSAGYAYPDAGEYQLVASHNADATNPNYLPASRTVKLTINKRDIQVVYGNTENIVYDGYSKTIPVTIRQGDILPIDSGTVTNEKLLVVYGGDFNIVRTAGNYIMTVSIDSNNYRIINNTKQFSIAKKALTIIALVNNSSRLVINEGDMFTATAEYNGFSAGEDRNHLQKPAYLPYIPKTAITDYEVMPFGASSINYTLIYVPAYITILQSKVSEIADTTGNAIVSGEYGSYVSLSAQPIEADVSNPEFYLINENIKKTFSSSDLLSDFKIQMAYRLSLSTDEEISSEPATVRLKLTPALMEMKSFVVLHFDSQGNYQIIGAYKEGDYLVFTSDPTGDFIIMTPRTGISPNLAILFFIAPIALFVIIILFYIVFRRKYDEG